MSVLTTPRYEAVHSLSERGVSWVAQLFSQRSAVGPGAGDVAGLDGDFAGDGFVAQGFLHCGYQVEYGDGSPLADVVDAGGGGGDGGLAAVPVGGALGGDGRSRGLMLRRHRRCR